MIYQLLVFTGEVYHFSLFFGGLQIKFTLNFTSNMHTRATLLGTPN